MVEKPEIDWKKCGEIFILPYDDFSLICYFCGVPFVAFEDFRNHMKEHFSKMPSLKHIKREDSSEDGDFTDKIWIESTTTHIKNEDSISYGNECEPNPLEIPDDVKVNFSGILKNEAITQPTTAECVLLPEQSESLTLDVIYKTKRNGPKRIRHRKRNYKCSFCCKIFIGNRDLKRHENIHTGKRPHICHLCSRTFNRADHLSNHIKALHTKERKHECLVCKKAFVTKSKLNEHTRAKHFSSADPPRYFSCQQCNQKFDTKCKLNYHKTRIHKQNSAKFVCNYCQQEFPHRHNIVKHMQLHAGTKNFECQHCNRKFAQAHGKWNHEQKCLPK